MPANLPWAVLFEKPLAESFRVEHVSGYPVRKAILLGVVGCILKYVPVLRVHAFIDSCFDTRNGKVVVEKRGIKVDGVLFQIDNGARR